MLTLTRVADAGPGSGTVRAELVGKWCYASTTSTYSSSAGSNECFTLNADGTSAYSRESSGSGESGSYASEQSDRGTWTATETTYTITSQTQGPMTGALDKPNHPRTGDAMLCLDDRCYITYYNRPPW